MENEIRCDVVISKLVVFILAGSFGHIRFILVGSFKYFLYTFFKFHFLGKTVSLGSLRHQTIHLPYLCRRRNGYGVKQGRETTSYRCCANQCCLLQRVFPLRLRHFHIIIQLLHSITLYVSLSCFMQHWYYAFNTKWPRSGKNRPCMA